MKILRKLVRAMLPEESNRNDLTVKFLKSGSWQYGIDVGARKSILLDKLDVKNKYALDFHNSADPMFKGGTLYHNLENGLPNTENGSSWDLIIANDVIEHVENKNRLANDIFRNCSSDVVISLPNSQHFAYLRGLFFGRMSKQFIFDVEDGTDRHRWITYYDENKKWMSAKASEHGFDLVGYDETWATKGAFHLLFLLHPKRRRHFVHNQVFHFKKR